MFSHHRTGFTFPYLSLSRWLDTFPYRCRATLLAAWCNMTTKTKQETYTTPGAIVHILHRVLPRLRYEWKESSGGSWKHAGKIGGRSRLWRARLAIAVSIVSVGMCGRDGKRWASPLSTASQPIAALCRPSRFQSVRTRVCSIDLIYCCS